MAAALLEGRKIADELKAGVRRDVEHLMTLGHVPRLAVVSVGDDPGSEVYIGQKKNACREAGIDCLHRVFPGSVKMSSLLQEVEAVSDDSTVHGVIVQLPLPPEFDEREVISRVSPSKDVDGLHPVNAGLLSRGDDGFIPCTPLGIVELLKRNSINLRGSNVTVIGRSNLVGRPLSILLSQKKLGFDATVTLCHTGTRGLKQHTLRADIVVSCAGVPGTVTSEMVGPDSVVVDVGISRVEKDGKKTIVGDVDFERVSKVVKAITPVPGGVGPLTVAFLLKNTVAAAVKLAGLPPNGM